MSDIVWEDPPPRKAGAPTAWQIRLEPLKQHIGEWGMVMEYPNSKHARQVASTIKRGQTSAGEGFEAKTRAVVNAEGVKVCRLYVRYVGGGCLIEDEE